MANLVDSIRATLGKRDGISEEAMRPLAATYSAEVSRVNARLSAAVELLHKGLRSEAIQSASLPPNAIDDAVKLDFPDAELEDWFDILQFLDIPVPPAVNRDLVDQLNEAIVDTQPIDALLKQHRRLAIARAPLAWRLKVLRRIATVDSVSTVWEEDIESWEKVRLKQIANEAPSVIASANQSALGTLNEELTGVAWRIPPDSKIVRQVRSALAGLAVNQTIEELDSLAIKLNDAFCEFDEASARMHLVAWNELIAKLKSPLPDRLRDQSEPVALWLNEVDRENAERERRAIAIAKLETALDQKLPIEDLEKAYQKTTLFDEPPPMELITRYRLGIEERQLTKKRRFQAIMLAIVTMAGFAIASLAWWQIDAAYQKRIAAAKAEFQSLMDVGNLESASKFYAAIQETAPEIAATSGVASLAGQLQSQLDEAKNKEAQFERYLSEANADSDADIDLSAVYRAEQLAVTDEQKGKVFALRRRKEVWESGLATQQTEELLAKLINVRTRLDTIEQGEPNDAAILGLNAILDELTAIQSSYPRASTSARGQISSIRPRAVSMKSAIRTRNQRMEDEDRVMRGLFAARSLDQLVASLQEFADKAPDSPMADEFKRVISERSLWDQALSWNEFATTVASIVAKPLTGENVKTIQSAKTLIATKVDQSPLSIPDLVFDRFDRYEERAAILERVLGGLPETVIADLYTVVESGGAGNRYFVYKSYYDRMKKTRFTPFPPDEKNKLRSIEFVVNDSGAVKSENLTGEYVVYTEPHATIQNFLTSYQTNRDAILSDWDGELVKLVATLRNRENLDGQLKEMLLQHLLSGACEGSDYLSKSMVTELRVLKSRGSAIANWYEPAKTNHKIASEIETSVIPRLGQLYSLRPQLSSDTATRIRNQQFTWVGLLVRRSDSKISVQLTQSKPSDCRLAIVRPSSRDKSKVDWVPIGEIKSGQLSLASSRGDLIAGRPVFAY